MTTTATPSAKDACIAKCAELFAKPTKREHWGLPQKTWASMDMRTRSVLVMLGASTMDDPRKVAQLPWESLSDADRAGIGACARSLSRQLKHATFLF